MERNEPTTGEIVRALRCVAEATECKDCRYKYPVGNVILCDHEQMNGNAADRLESQERKITEIENFHKEMLKDHKAQVAELTARAESAERERDAAIAEFEEYMLGNEDIPCKYCANHSTDKKCFPYTKSCEPKYNKWRGMPQDGEGK